MFITSRCSSFSFFVCSFWRLVYPFMGGNKVWRICLISCMIIKWRMKPGVEVKMVILKIWLFWLFYVITRFLYFPQTLKSVCVNISDNDRSNMNLWSDEQWGGENLKISEVAYFGVLSLVPHVEIFSWCFLLSES